MKPVLVAAFTTLVFFSPAVCQVPTGQRNDPFVFEVGSHQIPALVDRVAAYMGYDILYDANELLAGAAGGAAAQIRLTRRTEVDRKGCWEVASSLLQAHGFAILPLDPSRGFYQLVAVNGPRGREVSSRALFVDESRIGDYAGDSATPVLTSVVLEHINANIATNALRPFFAQSGGASGAAGLTFGTAGNNSSILVQGYGSQVSHAVQLLQQVDRPASDFELVTKVHHLEHTAPEDLEPILTGVLDARGRMRMQVLAEAGMPGAPASPPAYRGQILAVPSLCALALSGTATEVAEAMELIALLDVPAATPRMPSEDVHKRIQQLEERIRILEQGARTPK